MGVVRGGLLQTAAQGIAWVIWDDVRGDACRDVPDPGPENPPNRDPCIWP